MVENEYKDLKEKFRKVSRKLFEEWKLKFPKIYVLQNCANEIVDNVNSAKIENEDFEVWKSWVIKRIDIFITDLNELQHDYDEQLVRYKIKWTERKEKLDEIILEFRTKFETEL